MPCCRSAVPLQVDRVAIGLRDCPWCRIPGRCDLAGWVLVVVEDGLPWTEGVVDSLALCSRLLAAVGTEAVFSSLDFVVEGALVVPAW